MKRQFETQSKIIRTPNFWDVAAFIIIGLVITLIGWGAQQMATPYAVGKPLPISLSPHALPFYAIRTVLRMSIALIFSLLFSFTFGTLAAKYKRAEDLIIPTIDILQSVPILGFLSITVVGFIKLFPGSMLGPECAAIFAIFTSQAWNMALSFYQSLKTVPGSFKEVAKMYHLTSWQVFWRIEVPFATPSLLWNTMMSMSGSWFFVVASEAISVSNQQINLPGIGSYISVAILQQDKVAIAYAIFATFFVILLYDQLLFRPLLKWSGKFKPADANMEEEINSWVFDIFHSAHWTNYLGKAIGRMVDLFVTGFRLPESNKLTERFKFKWQPNLPITSNVLWQFSLIVLVFTGFSLIGLFIFKTITLKEVFHVMGLGLFTGTRVMIMIAISSIVWVPVGVLVGQSPRLTQIVQPIAQFLAAFPANLVYPVVVMFIMKHHLNVELCTTPLMVLGTQWYILFNVIAGSSSIPTHLMLVADNLGVKGFLWWKRIGLPAVFPYFVTGAITAAGGAWNASVVCEVINWGDTTLKATGLGTYISETTDSGDFPRIALGIGVMCLYVLILNRFFWRRLYNYASSRYHFE